MKKNLNYVGRCEVPLGPIWCPIEVQKLSLGDLDSNLNPFDTSFGIIFDEFQCIFP